MTDREGEPERTAGTVGADPPSISGSGSASAAVDISAVSLKLPPFWPADPEIWFVQVEAQFACRRITSQKSKFDNVVASLSPEFAVEVRDLLLRPPAENPYTALKEQLTKRTALSEQRRLQQLFTGEELGDQKPTQLLRRMQQLAGDRTGLDPAFLRALFLGRLPNSVRMVLASTPEGTTLDKLAEMADKVMEVAAPIPPPINAMTTPIPTDPTHTQTSTPASAADVADLRSEIARLEKLFRKLSHSRSSSRTPRSSRRSPSSTPPPNTSDSSLCWYHQTFGDRAQHCRQPCSWSLNGQAGN